MVKQLGTIQLGHFLRPLLDVPLDLLLGRFVMPKGGRVRSARQPNRQAEHRGGQKSHGSTLLKKGWRQTSSSFIIGRTQRFLRLGPSMTIVISIPLPACESK